MAVTGSQCLASCALTPGTVAEGLMARPDGVPCTVTLRHPMGVMDVLVDYELAADGFRHRSAGLLRTARKLAEGALFVPASVWNGDQ